MLQVRVPRWLTGLCPSLFCKSVSYEKQESRSEFSHFPTNQPLYWLYWLVAVSSLDPKVGCHGQLKLSTALSPTSISLEFYSNVVIRQTFILLLIQIINIISGKTSRTSRGWTESQPVLGLCRTGACLPIFPGITKSKAGVQIRISLKKNIEEALCYCNKSDSRAWLNPKLDELWKFPDIYFLICIQ